MVIKSGFTISDHRRNLVCRWRELLLGWQHLNGAGLRLHLGLWVEVDRLVGGVGLDRLLIGHGRLGGAEVDARVAGLTRVHGRLHFSDGTVALRSRTWRFAAALLMV